MPTIQTPRITKAADGTIRVRFGKRETEYSSIEHLRSKLAEVLDRETLEALALRMILDRRPTLDNLAALENRSLTIDLSQANWGTLG